MEDIAHGPWKEVVAEEIAIDPAENPKETVPKWNEVTDFVGKSPRPRHGHRALGVKNLMIVFGGGNNGIIDEVHVYDTNSKRWFLPDIKGQIPEGRASFGFVAEGSRILMFGGMAEYGMFSNELYELNVLKWEWRRLKPELGEEPPCPRIGHSFTLLNGKVYLFGGLQNESEDPKQKIPKYLNDLYTLEVTRSGGVLWEKHKTNGHNPSPRESHTCVPYSKDGLNPRLVIYGGMGGYRMGDVFTLFTETMTWQQEKTAGWNPAPRSLHTSTVIGNKMYVFGGWIPFPEQSRSTLRQQKSWKCCNDLAILNLDDFRWKEVTASFNEPWPKARAGHSAVSINNKMYLWAGRDGYQNRQNARESQIQIYSNDLWYLDVDKPEKSSRLRLLKSDLNQLDLSWPRVLGADGYILQICKVVVPFSDHVPQSSLGSSGNSIRAVIPSSTAV